MGKDLLHECSPNADIFKDKLFSLSRLLLKSPPSIMLSYTRVNSSLTSINEDTSIERLGLYTVPIKIF